MDLKEVANVDSATPHTHVDQDGTVFHVGSTRTGDYKYTVVKVTPPKPGEYTA